MEAAQEEFGSGEPGSLTSCALYLDQVRKEQGEGGAVRVSPSESCSIVNAARSKWFLTQCASPQNALRESLSRDNLALLNPIL